MRLPISGSKISFAAVFLVSLCFSTLLMWKTTRSLDSYNTGGSKKRRRAGCSRDAAEFYIPTDLKTCKQPRKVDWFNDFLAKNLKNNPLEPGCWEANNSCAPFPCFKLCETGGSRFRMVSLNRGAGDGKREREIHKRFPARSCFALE